MVLRSLYQITSTGKKNLKTPTYPILKFYVIGNSHIFGGHNNQKKLD